VYADGWTILHGEEAAGVPVQTVVVGPDALPYEIAYAAEAFAGRRIPRTVSVIVMPISAETICDSRRRGWLENLVSAGASLVDPRMAARLGLASILGHDSGDVLFTRPIADSARIASDNRRLWFSGIRTAAATALRGVVTLP
jgi:homoaconitase/3-isopropylmalate dehydratase large subunit